MSRSLFPQKTPTREFFATILALCKNQEESYFRRFFDNINNMEATNWYSKKVSAVLGELQTNEEGLSANQLNIRLQQYGKNKLPEAKADGIFTIFLRQFKSPLIYILLAAGVIVFFMGETIDSMIILAVLAFNAVVGTIQEGRAQNTLMALKKYTTAKTVVLRGGMEIMARDEDVVPGDIIILQEGNKVPADARIMVSNSLILDESAFTGESTPVHKVSEELNREYLSIAEQKNIIFKGTNIVSGSGRAVVVATGINTEIGKIAKQISSIDTEIPLKANIRYLSRAIIVTVAVINVLLLVIGLISGKGIKEMFVTLVSLSVSVIPEGLPIVMTLILATGVWRMSKRNALVKRLQAVEALGQAQVIALDKTGTITRNEMVVQKIFVGNTLYDIGGIGYEPKGDIRIGKEMIEPLNHPDLVFAIKNSALCTDARIMLSEDGKWVAMGDPTEAALLVVSQKIGLHKDLLENEFPSIKEFPFDYNLKYRASLRKNENHTTLMVSGAPENILNISKKVWRNGESHPMSTGEKEELKNVFEKISAQGFRVVALGVHSNPAKNIAPGKISNLTFVGFFAMKDPLRAEIYDAVQKASDADMKIIMVTGDHKITAMAIAREAGIYREGDKVMSGNELDNMTDFELTQRVNGVSVFSRVSPEHKLKIINAFKANKKVIAMTGDGVNDAPSLVAADLGIAMGKIGTEVAKEASDIILLDDNFTSIVAAIEEGRNIYKTIKKVILYLFSTNFGEVFTITVAILLGFPLPILPAQIIWLNFVTDGFLDVAIAMEPREEDLIKEKFKKPNKFLVDSLMLQRMFFMAVTMMIGTLFIFNGLFKMDLVKAQTMSLVVLAIFQWFNAWNCRSESKSIFQINPFSNLFLVGATIIVIVLQLLAVYNPFLQKILHTTPLTAHEWLLAITIALSIIVVEESRKLLYHRFKK